METLNGDTIFAMVLTFIYVELILIPILGSLWWGARRERRKAEYAQQAISQRVYRFKRKYPKIQR